jgi:hypothetical protein
MAIFTLRDTFDILCISVDKEDYILTKVSKQASNARIVEKLCGVRRRQRVLRRRRRSSRDALGCVYWWRWQNHDSGDDNDPRSLQAVLISRATMVTVAICMSWRKSVTLELPQAL